MNIFLVFFILLRALIEFIYPTGKPVSFQIFYVIVAFLVIFRSMIYYNTKDWLIVTSLIVFTSFSYFFSSDYVFEQFKYNLKVLIPALFAYSLKYYDIDFEKLRFTFKKITPLFLIISLLFFFKIYSENNIISDFDNKPFHTVSQVVAKFSILYIGTNILYGVFFVIILFVFNVRSNFVPIFAINIYTRLKAYNNWTKLLIIMVLVLLSSFYLSDLIDRTLYKGRISDDVLFNVTSGRTLLYETYISYILTHYSVWNYFVGTGSLFIQNIFHVSAHNDLLNVLVDHGILGGIALFVVYYHIYKSMEERYKKYVLFYFAFVFVTNGILFHQSNIIFVLYLSNKLSFETDSANTI